jgi:CopG family nickel-responsive transcriptional regulator
MPVVSVSLTEKNIELLERIQDSFGLTGRSEAIRACLRSAEIEMRKKDELRGEVEGVLVIVHDSHRSNKLDEMRHEFQEQVSTQIHSHLENSKCLEVFIVKGKADDIRKMLDTFRGEDRFEYIQFVSF